MLLFKKYIPKLFFKSSSENDLKLFIYFIPVSFIERFIVLILVNLLLYFLSLEVIKFKYW